MSNVRVGFLCAIIVVCLQASLAGAEDGVSLPVKKVELYKNGMGYFEHLGTVKGTQSVEITLPSSQLNDVLKSLTIIDLGKGQIGSVNYDSMAPIARRLAEAPIDLASQTSLVDMLNQIRGAAIEIRTPAGVVSGKLMGAELRIGAEPNNAQEVFLSVFTPAGEVKTVAVQSAGALRLTEQSLAGDMGRYLDLLNGMRQRDVRRLRIQTSGAGERQLFLGYTSEAPIWKSTYRIILDPKQKPLLQGWAIVDNTTSMDWLNVSLSLVAGAPISFVQDLSQPIYARRPIVPLPQGVQVAPQTHESAMEQDAVGKQGAGMPAERGTEGTQFSVDESNLLDKSGRTQSMAMMAAPPPAPRMAVSDAMRRQVVETAAGQAVAEQFEYQIRQPVTIRSNESALLPIIQADVEGEKVSIYQAGANERHPRLAFWLKNVSGLTLDAGPVTLIDANTFAGEGLIESVQPGESRLLSYAVDLGTEVSSTENSDRRKVEQIVINRGTMRLLSKMVQRTTYRIRNNNEAARKVVIEHPVRQGWKLVGAKPAETSASRYRFDVDARPKTTAELVVEEERPLESSFSVSSITPEQVAVWVRDRSIDPEVEKALRAVIEKKSSIDGLNQKIANLDREQNDIFRDQERVRGNLEGLSQNPEEASLRQRYIRQLETQENRLASITTERGQLQNARTAAQQQLNELIERLSLDKKL